MRNALVLAGGGARGAFQVGMLLELIQRQGMDFQILRGVSVGALNAALLAQAPTDPPGQSQAELRRKCQDLEKLWREEIQGSQSVYRKRWGGFAGLALGADSVYGLEPLRRLLIKHLSAEALRTSGRDFRVGVVSLAQGTYGEAAPADPLFLEKVLASASIPVLFPFVKINTPEGRDVLVDGGVRNITPLSSAFRARPEAVYVLLTSKLRRNGNALPDTGVEAQPPDAWDDNWLGTKVSGFDVLERTVEILTDEIYLDDLRVALLWNEVIGSVEELAQLSPAAAAPAGLVARVERLRGSLKGKKQVPIYVLAPHQLFGADNSATNFDPAAIANAIEHGRQIARDPALWLWPPRS